MPATLLDPAADHEPPIQHVYEALRRRARQLKRAAGNFLVFTVLVLALGVAAIVFAQRLASLDEGQRSEFIQEKIKQLTDETSKQKAGVSAAGARIEALRK